MRSPVPSQFDRHRRRIRNASGAAFFGALTLLTVFAHAQAVPGTVRDPAVDDPGRLAAAQALIAGADPDGLDELSLCLRADDPPGARRAAASAIAGATDPPAELLPPLIRAMELASAADQPAVMGALGRYPSTDAISAVMNVLMRDPGPAEPTRIAGVRAIVAQTGRDDLAVGGEALTRWWSRFSALPERDRRLELTKWHARRGERLAASLDETTSRLLDAYRRLYAATPEDARSDMLAELIRSQRTTIRMLGIELATRTILNARSVGPKVAEAAVESLTHPDPAVRAASAALVDRLNSAAHADACADVFMRETDPVAAASMMRYLGRHPKAEVADAALYWFRDPGPVSDAAAELILALLLAGHLDNPESATTIIEAIQSRPSARMTTPCIQLLAALGQDEQIVPLLTSSDSALAVSAATALGADGGHLALILDAALGRPELFEAACRALQRHRPDAAGFFEALSLPAANEQRKRDLLVEYSSILAPAELREVVRQTEDAATRELYLRRVGTAEYLSAADESATRLALAQTLVTTRMLLKDPAGALAVLDVMPQTMDMDAMMARVGEQVHCMIWLNRMRDAEALTETFGSGPDPWIDGLESALELPHALRVMDRIRTLFANELTPAQTARIDALERRHAERIEVGPASPDESVTPPPSGAGGG